MADHQVKKSRKANSDELLARKAHRVAHAVTAGRSEFEWTIDADPRDMDLRSFAANVCDIPCDLTLNHRFQEGTLPIESLFPGVRSLYLRHLDAGVNVWLPETLQSLTVKRCDGLSVDMILESCPGLAHLNVGINEAAEMDLRGFRRTKLRIWHCAIVRVMASQLDRLALGPTGIKVLVDPDCEWTPPLTRGVQFFVAAKHVRVTKRVSAPLPLYCA